MSSLFSQCYQEDASGKPALVLIHGWGAHSGVWQSVLPSLQQTFNVTCVDLPGHGNSTAIENKSIDAWTQAVLDVVPQKAIWLGWSLGGLLAQQAASIAPQRIEKLILVASTPKFITASDWIEAVDKKIFKDFHAEVIRDPQASLLRFIALQIRGSKTASQDSRLLRKTLLQPAPSDYGLDNGMQLLLKTDLRESISKITSPVLLLMGQRDTLVPKAAMSEMEKIFPDVESVLIKQAGHAPFISHPQEFCQAVNDFYFRRSDASLKETM